MKRAANQYIFHGEVPSTEYISRKLGHEVYIADNPFFLHTVDTDNVPDDVLCLLDDYTLMAIKEGVYFLDNELYTIMEEYMGIVWDLSLEETHNRWLYNVFKRYVQKIVYVDQMSVEFSYVPETIFDNYSHDEVPPTYIKVVRSGPALYRYTPVGNNALASMDCDNMYLSSLNLGIMKLFNIVKKGKTSWK
jgi:hypothetical protein